MVRLQQPEHNRQLAGQRTKWTLPLGGGAGRIVHVGKLPIKLEAGLFYNVVQPAYGGRWVLNTELVLIF